VLEHSRVLLHQPTTGGQGTVSDLSLQAKEVLRIRAQMEEILARHTGQAIEKLRADTDRDRIFSAQEAIDYGLADEIITNRKLVAA
jgi:ATP-dependent Clp protease protease subunit